MSEEANSVDEVAKEPCSPEKSELDSPDGADLGAPDEGCEKKEATEEHQVKCTGEEDASLDGEKKDITAGDSPEELSADGQSTELPIKEETDCASKDNNDDLYDKLSSSSPEPGELPDDDDPTGENAKNIKKEPQNGGSDTESPLEEVKHVKERKTSEDEIPMKIKKEQIDSERVKRERNSVDDSWEEETGSPKRGFYSDLEDDIPPKTPELKPIDKEPEPPKKVASIFEKKVKKEEGGSSEGILQEKLKQYFGHNDFKSALQKEAIQTIITSKWRWLDWYPGVDNSNA